MKLPEIEIVFLAYIRRSGSTFLASQIDPYSDIAVTIEADFPKSLLGLSLEEVCFKKTKDLYRYIKFLKDDYKFRKWNIDTKNLVDSIVENNSYPYKAKEIFPIILQLYARSLGLTTGKVVFKGKLPRPCNFNQISKNYPGCKMLSIIRDLRAVWLSQKNAINPINGIPLGISTKSFSEQWRYFVDTSICQVNEPNFFLVRYEDLMIDTENAIGPIIGWLNSSIGLREPAGRSGYGDRIPSDQNHLHGLVSKNADTSRVDRWKRNLPKSEIREIEKIASKSMKGSGFLPSQDGNSIIISGPSRDESSLLIKYRFKRIQNLLFNPGKTIREIESRIKGW